MVFDWPYQCFEVPGELEPNPDVGGIGVLIGFIGTAWFSTLLVVLHYLLVYNPEENPFDDVSLDAASLASRRNWAPNHIDQTALKAFNRFSKWMDRKLPALMPRWVLRREYLVDTDNLNKWAKALKDAVQSICDVQLLTGLGILLSGYVNLSMSSISAYHWHLIAYLVWFSHLTHIACLTVSRRNLHRNQAKRRLRLFFMAVLWMGLLAALGPTMWFNWMHDQETASTPASNARCFYHPSIAAVLYDKYGCQFGRLRDPEATLKCDGKDGGRPGTTSFKDTQAFQSALWSMGITVLTFFTRSVKLIESWSHTTKVTLCSRARRAMLRLISHFSRKFHRARGDENTNPDKASYYGLLASVSFFVVGKLYADLISSELSDAYWLVVSACWGTLRLHQTRNSVHVDENEWGFGQVLPVFLLIGPIAAAFGPVLLGGSASEEREYTNSSVSIAGIGHTQQVELPGLLHVSNPQRGSLDVAPSHFACVTHEEQSGNISLPRCFEIMRNKSQETVITGEMLGRSLETCYSEASITKSVVTLACFQVLPATIIFFTELSTKSEKSTFRVLFDQGTLWVPQLQNCILVIMVDLGFGKEHVTKREYCSVPITIWGFVGVTLMQDILFLNAAVGTYVALAVEGIIAYTVCMLVTRGW